MTICWLFEWVRGLSFRCHPHLIEISLRHRGGSDETEKIRILSMVTS